MQDEMIKRLEQTAVLSEMLVETLRRTVDYVRLGSTEQSVEMYQTSILIVEQLDTMLSLIGIESLMKSGVDAE